MDQLATDQVSAGYSFGGSLKQIVPTFVESVDNDSVDAFWMKEALKESMKSVGICSPNPAVGCVIVKDGREIARGSTESYGGRHAERVAIDKISNQSLLNGATAYVTLEPCSHHGKQPPCSSMLASLQLERIVIARLDSDVRVSGRGALELLQSRKKVTIGVLANEATAWNYPFFRTRASSRPFIALKWAQTIDGQLADDRDESQWISGPTARAYTHWLRQKYDAIIVGAQTFLQDFSRLDVRDCAPIVRQPIKIVFDPGGRVALSLPEKGADLQALLDAAKTPYFVLVKDRAAALALSNFSPKLVGTVIDGDDVRSQILSGLAAPEIEQYHGRALQSALVEGGPRLLTELAKTDLSDLLHVFVSPLITGGARHRVSPGRTLATARRFANVSTHRLGADILMEFVVASDWSQTLKESEGSSCFKPQF